MGGISDAATYRVTALRTNKYMNPWPNDHWMCQQLSPNFQRWEFACKCNCGLADIHPDTVEWCQRVRDFFERPVVVTSSCRCDPYNTKVGGSVGSYHKVGDGGFCRAADIVVSKVPAFIVQEFLDEHNVPGLGRYELFTHLDTREGRARW